MPYIERNMLRYFKSLNLGSALYAFHHRHARELIAWVLMTLVLILRF